jgi:hypothetical protein
MPVVQNQVENRRIFGSLNAASPQQVELDVDVRSFVIATLWPQAALTLDKYDCFFTYYQRCIQQITESIVEPHSPEGIFAMVSYGDFDIVVNGLRRDHDKTKSEAAQALRADFNGKSTEQCLRSMELVVRICLTLNVKVMDVRLATSGISFTWKDDISLHALVRAKFPQYRSPTGLTYTAESIMLDSEFTAPNLQYICGVKVKFIDNLANHLRYDDVADCVDVYPHKVCLISHLQSPTFFDADVLEETIRTLDLLFPLDGSTGRFLAKRDQRFHELDYSEAAWDKAIDLSEFVHWRRRLTILHQVFKRQPTKLYQMWHDRRNPLQWATFWLAATIAILTIVFGAISSYTSFRQVSLAQRAYDLSILQVCSENSRIQSLCPTRS